MMDYKSLGIREDGFVTVAALLALQEDRDKLIRLSAELSECCKGFRENAEAKVLVLTGESAEAFCIGKDLAEMGKDIPETLSLAESLDEVERPILIGIKGDAIGLGLELALACDIRIATETAHFGLPLIQEGLIPCDGGTQRLSRVVGKGKAMEMILTGELIDAGEARRIGLVTKVVSPEELMPITMEMAREIASKSPIAVRYAKEAINKGMDLTLEQGLRLEADLYFLLHTTKDRTEGIKAFREKRTPEFEGR